MHQGVQDAVDHPDVVVVLVLVFHVHEVMVEGIDATREQFADMEAGGRRPAQEFPGILHEMEIAWLQGDNGGGVRTAKDRGHLSENRTGLGGRGETNVVLGDLDGPADQEIKATRRLALPEDNFARGEVPGWPVPQKFQHGGHDGKLMPATREGYAKHPFPK